MQNVIRCKIVLWQDMGCIFKPVKMKFVKIRKKKINKMEEKMKLKLKKSFVNELKKRGINGEDVIFAATADFDRDFRFADTVVAVTKNELLIAAYPYKENIEYNMGGYGQKHIEEMDNISPAIIIYQLKDISKLEVIRQVSTGELLMKLDAGDKMICLFSNTRMSAFNKLCRIVDKIKKDEEILEEDLDVEKNRECCPKCGTIYPDQERKVCPKCMDKKSVLFRVMGYFKKYKLALVGMVFCYIATAFLNLAWPYLSGTVLYDMVLAKNDKILNFFGLSGGKFVTALIFVVIAMVVSKIVLQLLGIIQGVLTARIAPEVVATIKSQVFSAMGRLSISFFTKRQTGGLMTRVSDDAEQISHFFIDGVPYFFINVGTILATSIIMFILNPILAVITVAFMPLLVLISYRLLPYLWHFYGKRHRANRKMNGQLNENLTGARVVKAFGQEKQEIKRFDKNNDGVRNAELDLAKFDLKFMALYWSVEEMLTFLVWAVGGALVISNMNVSLGILITFSGYVGQLKGPLEFMSHIFRWYTNCMNSAQRLFEIMDAVPDVREVKEPYRPGKIKGEVELKNVTFSYEPNKPVLKDVSFHIKPGEVFGIVGRSGSGKSTLVNLISRLYDADEGEVLVDGINVKNYGFKELRDNVAMVSQETYIFMGTVAENIAYARPDATRAEIIDAAIRASAHDFVCKMPEGYDTIIGASSRSLSGGEKQRISIARAILANPKILILDEATSAVDTETELAIQESLEQLEKGRTVISIAHRLSTLRNAKHLIVLDEGRITESGTHSELMEKKGTYYKLNELQTKALAMRGLE